MGAAATYRVGRSDFFLPSDLASDAETLNAQVDSMDAMLDNDTGSAPQSWVDSWHAFYVGWKNFWTQHFAQQGFFGNLFTALNDSNRDDLVSYEDRFDTWASDASKYGVGLPEGQRVSVSQGSGDQLNNQLKAAGLPSLGTLGIAAGVGLALIVAWKVIK